ncbi:MAG: hypothetical protein ACRC7H_03975 [Plesiomonas shigelloides]|uniref:hypothetical protein n=1 Tax=Cetobacterium sp. TaxID=2071632 RepID=UPI003EE528C5
MEDIKIIASILGAIAGGFLGYHKYMMFQIDKKVDQKLYDKEVDHITTNSKNNFTNLNDKIVTLAEDVKIIKTHILSVLNNK